MVSFINLAILGAVATYIIVCSSAIVCENHLRFVAHGSSSGSVENEICWIWALRMNQLLGWISQEESPSKEIRRRSEGLFVVCIAFPFFLVSTIVYTLSLLQKKKKKNSEKHRLSSSTIQNNHERPGLPLGDPPIHWWSFLVLFLPTALICVDVLWNNFNDSRFNDMSVLWRSAILLTNPFGVAACISLSFFLVPVARGSYTIEWETDSDGFGWSWSPMHALVFHRWAGWSSAFFTGLHAVIYCLIYITEGKEYYHQSPLQALWSALVPGRECWPSWFPWSHYNEGSTYRCYGRWRNFMGTISALSFLVLCLTSFPFIRRRFYNVFYKTHIVAGSMMLVFAILHFETILMYLFPSMVYYLATTIPTLIQQYLSYKNDGVRIKSITSVQDSGGCVEVIMPMSSLQHQPFPDEAEIDNVTISFSSFSTPVYARVCVPSISAIWHPFSVMIKSKEFEYDDCISGHTTITSSSTMNSPSDDDEQILSADPLLTNRNLNERDQHSEHTTIDDDEVVIFFRPVGPFTTAWANSLISTMVPHSVESEDDEISPFKTLLVEGFYPGAFPIPKIMQRHDSIIMMAGGVGIVPFVSVLQAWYHCRKQICRQQRQQQREDHEQRGNDPVAFAHVHRLPRKIILYWSCREQGLINHFLAHHLDFLWRADDGNFNCDLNEPNIPSIELFCHLTRGGSARSSTLLPNEQSALQQPLISDLSSLECTLPSNSSLSRYGDDEEEGDVPRMPDIPYRKPSISHTADVSSNSLQDTTNFRTSGGRIQVSRFDWVSFIVFALILWFSFLVQAWQYSRRILAKDATIVRVRFNSIYLTLVWSVFVAMAGECFRAWYFQKQFLQRSVNEDTHSQSEMECHQGQIEEQQVSCLPSNGHTFSLSSRRTCDAGLTGPIGRAIASSRDHDDSRLTTSSFVHRSKLVGEVSVHIVAGRPNFQDALDPIGNSDCPAVLLCGPEKLRGSVRRTVQDDKKCAKKCSIYEEVSEM